MNPIILGWETTQTPSKIYQKHVKEKKAAKYLWDAVTVDGRNFKKRKKNRFGSSEQDDAMPEGIIISKLK